jgi:formylglycine-generating enzyme required for sulfatase activity
LWEFTLDAWSPTYEGAPADGSARNAGRDETDHIVLRGGSWKSGYRDLRSASRKGFAKDAVDDAVGFRCVRAKVENGSR